MPSRQDISFAAFVVDAGFVGEAVAFALGDGTVRFIADGEERIVEAHKGAVLAACVTPDAIVTGGDDGRVVASRPDGSSVQIAERPRKWIDLVTAGPNGAIAFATGRQAVVVNRDGSERVFDHERAVGGLAFAPKGFRLAVARYNGASLWWAGRDAPPVTLEWNGAHLDAAFSPDGRHLVTAMQENALHGWRLADGRDMRMTGYPAKPRSLSWSWKGRYLASSGANAAILWPFHHKDGPMGREPLQVGPREPLVSCVACHPWQEAIAIGYRDGALLLVLGLEGGSEVPAREASDSPVSALTWNASGNRFAFGTESGAAGIVTLD